MNVTTEQVLHADMAISKMKLHGEVRYRLARDLYRLKKTLAAEAQVAQNIQVDIINDCGGTIANENRITFRTVEDRKRFEQRWNTALSESVDIPLEPIDLSDYTAQISFSAVDVDFDALSKFISFEKEAQYG